MKKLEIKNSNIKGGFPYQNGLKTTVPPKQKLPHFGVKTNQSQPEIIRRVTEYLDKFKNQFFK